MQKESKQQRGNANYESRLGLALALRGCLRWVLTKGLNGKSQGKQNYNLFFIIVSVVK